MDGQDGQDEKKKIKGFGFWIADLKFEISNLKFIYPVHPVHPC
jgi:hypothetical protein